jgi:hypothetical protein
MFPTPSPLHFKPFVFTESQPDRCARVSDALAYAPVTVRKCEPYIPVYAFLDTLLINVLQQKQLNLLNRLYHSVASFITNVEEYLYERFD